MILFERIRKMLLNRLKLNYYSRIRLLMKFSPLYYRLYRSLTSKTVGLVNEDTEIVLEAYPRCGNTFGFYVLQNLRSMRIAHHTHSLANIKAGLRKHIAVVVLVRNPYDAISSEILRKLGAKREIRYDIEALDINALDLDIYALVELQYYSMFYNFIASNHKNILLVSFETLICNTGLFITEVDQLMLKKDLGFLIRDASLLDVERIKYNVRQQISRKENYKNLDPLSKSIPDSKGNRYDLKKYVMNIVKKCDSDNHVYNLYRNIQSLSI